MSSVTFPWTHHHVAGQWGSAGTVLVFIKARTTVSATKSCGQSKHAFSLALLWPLTSQSGTLDTVLLQGNSSSGGHTTPPAMLHSVPVESQGCLKCVVRPGIKNMDQETQWLSLKNKAMTQFPRSKSHYNIIAAMTCISLGYSKHVYPLRSESSLVWKSPVLFDMMHLPFDTYKGMRQPQGKWVQRCSQQKREPCSPT